MARAVVTLHRAGVIHRDIKPDNILLLKDGGLKLLDLGVARLPQLEDFPADAFAGTPSYMAPELFCGAPGDEVTDLFALGVTVYRMFTRSLPYGEIEPFRSRGSASRPRSRQNGRTFPPGLTAAISRAIAVDPCSAMATCWNSPSRSRTARNAAARPNARKHRSMTKIR